jgi:hypothetical protein
MIVAQHQLYTCVQVDVYRAHWRRIGGASAVEVDSIMSVLDTTTSAWLRDSLLDLVRACHHATVSTLSNFHSPRAVVHTCAYVRA